jgi:glycosyltransferase involved in cell wall biosynthesis
MDISVIIPVYNEELNIDLLFNRLTNVMLALGVKYELIFVNDGSKDNSIHLVKKLAAQHQTVRYIDLSRNFGHQIAVSAGIDKAIGNAIVIIDADLQDPPELIHQLYAKMQEGYDVVYAKRNSRKGESFLKLLTARLFYRILSSITSVSIPVDTGDFRIISRRVVEALKQMPETNKYLRGQIAWIGYEQTFVSYNREERNAGKTGYTYRKMFKLALDGITAFSNFPIKLVTFMGFFVSAIAFVMILVSFYIKYFTNLNTVQGWTSLMVGLMFFGGVQLISLGIIGEYISRINTDVRKRPLYLVKESNIEQE